MIELGAGGSHTVPLFDKKGEQTGTFMFTAKEQAPGEVCCVACLIVTRQCTFADPQSELRLSRLLLSVLLDDLCDVDRQLPASATDGFAVVHLYTKVHQERTTPVNQ